MPSVKVHTEGWYDAKEREGVKDMPLTIGDEGIHHIDVSNPGWRENWYFNFFDHRTSVHGIASVGVRPNIRRGETVFAVFEGHRALHVFNKFDIDIPPDIGTERQHYGPLAVESIQPFKEWVIRFDDGMCRAEMTWKAISPPYDYDWTEFEKDARHYQHAGLIDGSIVIKDRTIRLQGFGERDHAWGPREYGLWDQTYWVTGQFSKELCFHACNLSAKGKDYLLGFLHKDGETSNLTALAIDAIYGYPGGPVLSCLLRMQDEDGRTLEVRSELMNVLYMLAAQAGMESHYFVCLSKFTCGDLVGYGTVDHIITDRRTARYHFLSAGRNWGTIYHNL